jgi:hypothetical protein
MATMIVIDMTQRLQGMMYSAHMAEVKEKRV